MNTKKMLNVSLFALLVTVAISCGPDNYEKPSSQFSGSVVYNNQPLGVRGSGGDVYLQFWQAGYELNTSFNVYVAQDGSYSALLHDGSYKLVMNANRGPWVNSPDTVYVEVKGKTVKDYPVTPYYTIGKVDYRLSGTTLTASFDVTQVNASRNIEYVALMVNDKQFVDIDGNSRRNWVQNMDPSAGHFEMVLDISDQANTYAHLYARVGVKIAGTDHAIYDTNVEKIK